jgi:hypothetical protein
VDHEDTTYLQYLHGPPRRCANLGTPPLDFSGGKLNIDKCKFYILCWKFTGDGFGSLLSKDELQVPPLLLTEGATCVSSEVAQSDLDDPFKTLGIHKTISGNQSVQIRHMKHKSDAYARGILSVNVTHFEAWNGLFTVWFGQMNYPLAATSLSQAECRKIESHAINALLSKCGFSRKTARAIIFGSPWFGGLGWRHLHFEQGTQHVLTLIKHLRTPGPFQSLLHIGLHWHQVIAGVSFSPFLHPGIPLPYLDNAWLDSTRQFLKHCSAQLEIPSIPLPVSKRRNDACIMDGFIGLGLSLPTLQQLNFCRLWLWVAHLSDICALAGDCIDRTAWLGLDPMPSSAADWPMQPRPHDTVWRLWRRALSDSVCSNTHRHVTVTRPGALTSPLGNWCADYDPQASPHGIMGTMQCPLAGVWSWCESMVGHVSVLGVWLTTWKLFTYVFQFHRLLCP